MTTDIVIRYADDINSENEIANFERYNIYGDSISAVSWELPGVPRKNGGVLLLKKMIERLSLDYKIKMINVMVELATAQPDNAIVNYKKTWGLLKSRGIKVDSVSDKINFIKKTNDGLVLSGFGGVDPLMTDSISAIFNCNEKVYFFIMDEGAKIDDFLLKINLKDWMSAVWDRNGVVFLLMGYFDEADCEIVAFGHKSVVKKLL